MLRPVFKCPPPSFPPFIPVSVTLLLTFTALNWRRGRRRECLSLFLIFEIVTKIGYKPLMLRREGVTPPPKKNNVLFVVCTHRLQHPSVPMHVCSKVIQVGADSAKREMSVLKSAHLCIALHAELFGVTAMGPAAFSWCRETSRPHWRGHWTPSTEQTSP